MKVVGNTQKSQLLRVVGGGCTISEESFNAGFRVLTLD